MDSRQSLARTPSTNVPQGTYNPNMASAHPMSYYGPTHLPPIQSYHAQPPSASNQTYLPQQYRPELSRYQSTPTQMPDRYSQHIAPQHNMAGLPPSSMLPQPNGQNQPSQSFTPTTAGQPFQQRLAPAPPRPNLTPLGTSFTQGEDRPPLWSTAEQMPSMTADNGRDPTRTHVVGSQGRRGILPSAPGRAQVMPNGLNGPPKGNAIPAKDADGKFPCPNCNKTYLHAKHLKRHMLRHTGDRPYMCVLCNDTFSRSDILKRHFQKCSVRRGNPTGASHLSNPAAHLKKSAAAQAKAQTESPNSTSTPTTTGMTSAPFASSALSAGPITPAASTFTDGAQMQYGISNNQSGDMQRIHPNQPMQSNGPQSAIGSHPNGTWSMQNPRGNQLMYHSNPATPDHFAMQHGSVDDKRNAMSGPHQHMGDDWNQMFQAGGNENYMNPIFPGYDQAHHEVKSEAPEAGSNGYYISSTSLGADGTLGPPLWNQDGSQDDPLQLKADRLVDFCFPAGIQESLQEQQNNFHIRSLLTTASIKHFLDLFRNFQGHFPWLHMPTFNFIEAYDGIILVILCIGAAYSDQVSRTQVRGLMERTRRGIERTAHILNGSGASAGIYNRQFSSSNIEFEELQALLMLQTCFIWHGGPEERAAGRENSKKVFYFARQYGLLDLAQYEQPAAFSYLHNLAPGEAVESSRWQWRPWIEQEKRSRVMFLIFLLDAALTIYFNCQPEFDPSEIRLPLPCDDAAWEAPDAHTCSQALGLQGAEIQSVKNISGSLRMKQLEMHHMLSALHDVSVNLQARTTNVYSKFILVHALHVQIWQVQRRRSLENSSQNYQRAQSPIMSPQTGGFYRSISNALARWKQSWDEDLALQYPVVHGSELAPRRFGFCRDGVHFYWLALALMKPSRIHDWRLPADARFQFIMKGLKQAREWSRSDGARRGEEPGSVGDIDHTYATEALDLDMRKLFRPIEETARSPRVHTLTKSAYPDML